MEARKQESEVRSLVQRATDELVVAVLADKKTEKRKNPNISYWEIGLWSSRN